MTTQQQIPSPAELGAALGAEMGTGSLAEQLEQQFHAQGLSLSTMPNPAAPPAPAPNGDAAVRPGQPAPTAAAPAAPPNPAAPPVPNPADADAAAAEVQRQAEMAQIRENEARWRSQAMQAQLRANAASREQYNAQHIAQERAKLITAGFSEEAATAAIRPLQEVIKKDADYIANEQEKQAVVFELARQQQWGVDVIEQLMNAQNTEEFNRIVTANASAPESPREKEMRQQLENVQKELAEVKKGQAPPQEFGGLGSGTNATEAGGILGVLAKAGSDPDYYARLSEEQKQGLLNLAL